MALCAAGKAALNQRIRVIKLGSSDPDALAAPGEEGQIVADLAIERPAGDLATKNGS